MIKVRCPNCWKKSEIAFDEIPVEVYCPKCGAKLSLQAAYVPADAKQLELAAAT